MKKVFSVLGVVAFIFVGCNSQTTDASKTQSATAENASPKVETVKPTMLTKQKFLTDIMDYENNPNEWNYKGQLPGIIDFYADWCRPCRITSPILEELAQEYAGQITIYKIDVQAEQELASVFGIQSIPTFLFMPMNDKPVMSSGIAQTPEATKEMFRQQIDEILLGKTSQEN